MFRKGSAGRDGVETLIGVNSVFTGGIEAVGTVRVDGQVKGDLKVTGNVYVGEQATVKGNIDAANVHLSGTIEGNITTSGILRIKSSAKLYGDIKVNSFVADEGALFQGKCDMMEAAPSSEKTTGKAKRNYKKSSVLEDIYEDAKEAD
jgi:cytoskeletal protein CcmA (bactofilin family)